MDITIVQSRPTNASATHAHLLARGCERTGFNASLVLYGQPIKTKKVACWGWRKGYQLRRSGHDVLVMERGYLGDRFSYSSLGWNGLNGYASFPEFPSDSGSRFKQLGLQVSPWKKGGQYALLLGQVPHDMSLKGLDIGAHYMAWADTARRKYGIPIAYRPHPEAVRRGVGHAIPNADRMIGGTLDEALVNAAFCITYNSNSAVESILSGTPVIALDRGSMVYDLCAHTIGDELIYPPREEFLYRLAWTQWTQDEIENGAPLRPLMSLC